MFIAIGLAVFMHCGFIIQNPLLFNFYIKVICLDNYNSKVTDKNFKQIFIKVKYNVPFCCNIKKLRDVQNIFMAFTLKPTDNSYQYKNNHK